MKTRPSLTLLAAAIALATASAARASILTAGNFQTGTPTPTLSFSAPITFNITTTGTAFYFDLRNWVTSDGTQDGASATNQFLTYQINGGTAQTAAISRLIDNVANMGSAFSPNDGVLLLTSGIAVTAGQTLTFNAGSLTFGSGGTGFNPPPTVFNGNAYLLANNGSGDYTRLSADTAVPEPSAWAALAAGAGLLGILTLRRRVARA